jgi:hypothetical protein
MRRHGMGGGGGKIVLVLLANFLQSDRGFRTILERTKALFVTKTETVSFIEKQVTKCTKFQQNTICY